MSNKAVEPTAAPLRSSGVAGFGDALRLSGVAGVITAGRLWLTLIVRLNFTLSLLSLLARNTPAIMKFTYIASAFIASILLAACDSGPKSKMRGEYIMEDRPDVSLLVTGDTITAKGGPMIMTANFKVTGVNDNTLTVEFTAPNTPPGTSTIDVTPTGLDIHDNFIFGGRWKRK